MISARRDLVKCCDPLSDSRWDARLDACAGATFFHGTAWARVLHDTYGYVPSYFFADDADGPLALPTMEVNSWLTGRRGITLPFTDECEALCTNPDTFQWMFRRVLDFAQGRRWKYYELRGGRALVGDVPASLSFYGHRLALHPNPTALFAKFDSAVRRAVRKAEQENLTIEFAQDLPAMRTFYELLCKTRNRHGLPPQPFRFFEKIWKHVMQVGKGKIVLAKLGPTPVAGIVFFEYGKSALYKFAASDEAFQQVRGNNLVLWKAIEHYAIKGFTSMDFGRTSLPSAGLRRFKLSWGSVERPIEYVRYDQKENAFVTSTDRSTGSWHTVIFRSLPGKLSRLVGAAAYRHLA